MESAGFAATMRRALDLWRVARAARRALVAPERERAAARRALAGLMADARGVPMKVGQFLSTLEESGAFDELAQGVSPEPVETMLACVAEALGRDPAEVFDDFDPEGVAASLGQVHRARLRDGALAAVKIRYPGIGAAVDAELRLASLLPGMGPVRRWGFDVDAYRRALRENLDRELDYVGEARRQGRFRAAAAPGIVVPEPFLDLCRPGVLVQRWEDGVPLEAAARWPVPERRATAETLLRGLLHAVLVSGHLHGDPHAGNYRFRLGAGGQPEVVLYDFGCTVEIPDAARLALLKLLDGARTRRAVDPLACFAAMGFDAEKLTHIAPRLSALCGILFEPFLVDGLFSARYWRLGSRVEALFGELKWWFRSAGPPELLFLMRAFHGLVAQLETLGVAVSWRQALDAAVPRARWEEARAFEPRNPGVRAPTLDSVAQYLKVQVLEHGRQIVGVTLPAPQVVELESIIPDDVRERIAAAGVDLGAIRQRAVASGIVPQELFHLPADPRSYRVWLE